METQIDTVLTEVGALAMRRGWPRTTALVNGLATPDGLTPLVVIAPAGLDVTPFQAWIAGVLSQAAPTVLPLASLLADPLLAVGATQVLGVFPCDQLVDPAAIDVLGQVIFSRPVGSYAFVLVDAGRIQTEKDLTAVERVAWGALVPGPKPTSNRQALAEQSVYLWAAPPTPIEAAPGPASQSAEPAGWLQARLGTDAAGLAAWLRTPVSSDDLARYQVLFALETAMGESAASEQARAVRADPQQPVRRARQEVSELRSRLLSRLDSSADTLDRALQSSVALLESDLLSGLRAYLNVVQLPPGKTLDQVDLQGIVATYVAQRAEAWQRQTNDILLSFQSDLLDSSEALSSSVNWALVNQLAARSGKATTYPQVLLDSLRSTPVRATPALVVGGDGMHETGGQKTNGSLLRVGVGAGAISLVAITLIQFGPLAALLVSAIGGAGVIATTRLTRGRPDLNRCETEGRAMIQNAVHKTIASLRQQWYDSMRALRWRADAEFDALDKLLAEAMAEKQPQATGEGDASSDMEQLKSYWVRVTELEQV